MFAEKVGNKNLLGFKNTDHSSEGLKA